VRGRSRVQNLPDAMCTKTVVICDWWNGHAADRWGPPRINFFLFLILKISFLKKSLPCVFLTLGKLFIMCSINGTRQRASLPMTICRVQHIVAHGKRADSRSAVRWVLVLDPVKFLLVFIDLLPSCY